MLTALFIFAGLRNINLSIALERRKDITIESPAYDLIKEEGIEEGIEKGIEEGIEKAFY